jgi:hypothetical protein
MNVEEMVKVLAMEHYRRIMNDTIALLVYCQVFSFTSLEKALEDVVKSYMALKEGESGKQ